MIVRRFADLWRAKWVQAGFSLAWIMAVILLPITSLPWLVDLSGATTVAPPSVIFFLGLAIAWWAPEVLLGKQIIFEIKPFLLFLLVVGIAWAAALFLPVEPFRGHSIQTEYKEALITVVMAASVYIVTATWLSQHPQWVKITMQLINLSGLVLVAWSLVQALYVLLWDGHYANIIYRLQSLVSSRPGDLLFQDRVTGMAFEPSWLAHQLVLVYLPVWLSALINGYSAFKWRKGLISLESILLVSGVFVLFMSFSRIGWLSFLLALAYLMVLLNINLTHQIKKRLQVGLGSGRGAVFSGFVSTGIILSFGLGYFLMIAGLVWLGARFEPRLARILTENLSTVTGFLDLTNRLFFAERAVYWTAGLNVFGTYPWLGVGPGNAGLFFSETMPSLGYALTEIMNMFYRFTFLPNTKSMWIRLLAETGMIGFTFFITWLFLVFRSARLAFKHGTREIQVLGLVGQLALAAYLSEAFSLDSFAMPYIWFCLGLVSAACVLTRRQHESLISPP